MSVALLQKPTGVAQLPDNYDETLSKAEAFKGLKLSPFGLLKLLAHGCADLSDQELRLLLFYVADINLDAVSRGDTAVWKGSRFAQYSCGWSKSKVARVKGDLRDKGLITVHYDHRNRPMEGQHVTLAPIFSEYGERIESSREAVAARKAAYEHSKTETTPSINGTKGPNLKPNIQTPQKPIKYTVPGDADNNVALTEKTPRFNKLCNGPSGKDPCDFERRIHSGDGLPSLSDQQRQCIDQTLSMSEKLRGLIDKQIVSTGDELQLYGEICDAVQTLWPTHNTAQHTLRWAFRRYGWQLIDLLVVATEDPNIQNPQNWFGHMATRHEGELNLIPNIARMKKKQLVPPPSGREPETRFEKALYERVGEVVWASWFTQVNFVTSDRELQIVSNNKFNSNWIEEHYGEILKQALKGHKINQINYYVQGKCENSFD